jgi:hypothetical protein
LSGARPKKENAVAPAILIGRATAFGFVLTSVALPLLKVFVASAPCLMDGDERWA